MDVFQCIETRVAVRDFKPDPVSEDVVQKILEAGRLAPSQRNRQQWHFIVVKDKETLKQMGSLASTGPYIADASFAIVIAMEPNARLPQVDAARAAENMLLVAWAEGVGTCWVGGFDRDKVKELLDIPQDMQLITIMPYGYPKEEAQRLKKRRKPLEQIAYRERFGVKYYEG